MYRIEKLRKQALERRHCNDEFHAAFFKAYLSDGETPLYARYTKAYKHAFAALTPVISENELIVGKLEYGEKDEPSSQWIKENRPEIDNILKGTAMGQDSHMSIDYDLLLTLGIDGILKKIDALLADCDEEKREFYLSCKGCLEAVKAYSEKYAEYALALSKDCSDCVRCDELQKIAEVCLKVPAKPAESFYEAVQSVHFITHCLSLDPFRLGRQQFQLGHPDRYLYKFYVNDIKNGAITNESARVLLDCLAIQINNRVPNGLSSGYLVGGRDKDGKIVANELTELLIEVINDVRLVYPAVGLCYASETPDHILKIATQTLLCGRSHPAIFNDDIITEGLMSYGLSEAEAHDYTHSTCVEITPTAASNVWVASPYTNLPQLLLECLDREYADPGQLISRFFALLDASIKQNFEIQNSYRVIRKEHSIKPLLSCFVNDCLRDGVDIERGGARYNWIMPSFVGMANVVDALYALDEICFKEHSLSIAELKGILDSNFEGNEALRQKILRLPKYGNDIDEVDSYFELISKHIIAECEKYTPIMNNGKLIPSVFCWVMHERLGSQTGATPDGRTAGFPLGDGSGPCQGREKNGPTASIISSTKWDHSRLIGGVAVNMKFAKRSLGENSADTLCSLIKTFMARGGFEMQINVIDNETLKKAQADPESYRDLVVRIGGYSDYFVSLSRQMQNEVLLRSEHEI